MAVNERLLNPGHYQVVTRTDAGFVTVECFSVPAGRKVVWTRHINDGSWQVFRSEVY